MPILLRKDTIRLFEASIECLQIAVSSLGSTRRVNLRDTSATYAAEIGLIGASAEMAMSACLVQAYGTSILELPSGHFKSFPVKRQLESYTDDN